VGGRVKGIEKKKKERFKKIDDSSRIIRFLNAQAFEAGWHFRTHKKMRELRGLWKGAKGLWIRV
jgi:hypothetical protein